MKRKTYRSKKIEEEYQKVLGTLEGKPCFMCNNEPVHTWKRWKLFVNNFPYDEIAEKNMLLCLNDHREEMNGEDFKELQTIKKLKFMSEYHGLLENLAGSKSIPDHFHFHVIKRLEDKN